MARLLLDTTNVSYRVATNPEAKMDDKSGRQKMEARTGVPMWTVKLFAVTESDAETITVTVVNPVVPQVSREQLVRPVTLEALPWVNEDADRGRRVRSGVAFRCRDLVPVEMDVPAAA